MARGRVLTEAERGDLQRDAASLPEGSLRPWCEEQAKILGCHWSTIYRVIRPKARTRKKRSDAGAIQVYNEQDFRDIAAMVVQFDYDVELAIDTVNANRVRDGLEELDVHPETVRRHLRDRGVSRRHNTQDLRIHRRFEAPYPLYMFQMDSTVAAQYFIDVDDSIGYETAVALNKTKKGNERPRIWLLAGVDDHSRVRWGRFYTSNSALTWHDFMLRCWRGFADPDTWPAYGVPERLYTDQDSAMKSAVNVRALQALGVQRMLAQPSTEHETNAQAKGKAEAAIRVLQGFEKISRWQRFESLEAMNEALLDHLIWLNNRPHSSTGETPFQRWLRARKVTVLPPQEITRRLSYREDERTIRSDVTVHLEGRTFQLPRRKPFVDYVGHKVPILYCEADISTISVILDGDEHEVDAVDALPDTAGEFKGAETPESVTLKRELQEHDLGHLDPRAVHPYRRKKSEQFYPIRPPETAHPLTGELLAPRMVRKGRAIDRAQKAGVMSIPPAAAERAAFEAVMAGRKEIPEPELEAWIESRLGRGDEGVAAGVKKA